MQLYSQQEVKEVKGVEIWEQNLQFSWYCVKHEQEEEGVQIQNSFYFHPELSCLLRSRRALQFAKTYKKAIKKNRFLIDDKIEGPKISFLCEKKSFGKTKSGLIG